MNRLSLDFLAALAAVVVSVTAAEASVADWLPDAMTPQEEWRPLGLDRIELGGVFRERIDRTVDGGILKIDADETFLRPFVEKKGADGTYVAVGKFTEACVLLAKHTRDPRLVALKERLVDTLLRHQLPDGYPGCIARPEDRLVVTWDAHECAYIQTALMADWEEFANEKALAGARRVADYVLANWRRLPAEWGQVWCNVPMYAIGQCRAMLRLYEATKDVRYLDFCLRERALADFDTPVFKGRDLMVWGHVYTYLEQCLAQQHLYRLTRESRVLGPTARAMDFLLDGDGALITGLAGVAECWSDAQDGDGDVGETCATAYQLFDYDGLVRLGLGDTARLGDAMERTIYNGLFAAGAPDGRKVRYYTPTLGRREYFDKDVYCCPNNFKRALARLPQWVFYTRRDALLVNLYTPCRATTEVSGAKVALAQETDYPTSGRVKLVVSPERPTAFSVFVRVPKWCTRPSVRMCGVPIRQVYGPGQLLRLTKTWSEGDVIELDFPMDIRTVRGRVRQAGRFAVMRGPLVYALDPADHMVRKADRPDEVREFFARHPFDIQKTMTVDPKSLRLSAKPDDSSRTGGTALEVEANIEPFAIGVYHWGPQVTLRLHEFADPEATITYFRAPDLTRTVTGDDEVFR